MINYSAIQIDMSPATVKAMGQAVSSQSPSPLKVWVIRMARKLAWKVIRLTAEPKTIKVHVPLFVRFDIWLTTSIYRAFLAIEETAGGFAERMEDSFSTILHTTPFCDVRRARR